MRKRVVLYLLMALTSGTFANTFVKDTETKKIGLSNSLLLELAPGPVNRDLVINFSEAGTGATITITDLKGSTLLNKAVEAGSTKATINVSKLEPGSYFVVLNNGNFRNSKLFTKQ